MAYVAFIIAEVLGALLLAAFAKGIIGIIPAFLAMVVMLALSFHVLARGERPDQTSIRIASITAVLWYGVFLGGMLATENRGAAITIGAALFTLFCATQAAFATWSLIERPLNLDLGED